MIRLLAFMLAVGQPAFAGYETGTANQVLRVPSTGGRPKYGALDLSSSAATTNSLANTKLNGFTSGGCLYGKSDGTLLNESTSNCFWDQTNHSLSLGNTSVLSSALLELDSTSKGFLPPRMTTAQKNAIASPATGLTVFDTNLNALNIYNGSSWGSVGGAAGNSITWSQATVDSNLSAGTGYIANSTTAALNFTLPATCTPGDTYGICGGGGSTLGWAVKSNAAAASQVVNEGSLSGATSSSSSVPLVYSSTGNDCLTLMCISSSIFNAVSYVGTNFGLITGFSGGNATTTLQTKYKQVQFTSSGTFTITSGTGYVYSLVVAGGGSGAGINGGPGGGGAGGCLFNGGSCVTQATTPLLLGPGTYAVTVGAGGAGNASGAGNPGGGSSVAPSTGTSFTTISAVGGGGGGVAGQASPGSNANGGSGGGGSSWASGIETGGTATTGQGFAGGAAASSQTSTAGGGGGASAVGQTSPNSSTTGNGGAGINVVTMTINGVSVTVNVNNIACGGGAGINGGSGTVGTGGCSSAGNGGKVSLTSATAGAANSGSGGGGEAPAAGANGGGSGVVYLWFQAS